jgi:hypothetical protein
MPLTRGSIIGYDAYDQLLTSCRQATSRHFCSHQLPDCLGDTGGIYQSDSQKSRRPPPGEGAALLRFAGTLGAV